MGQNVINSQQSTLEEKLSCDLLTGGDKVIYLSMKPLIKKNTLGAGLDKIVI